MKNHTLSVSSKELAAILCGLRLYQEQGHIIDPMLLDIAQNSGEFPEMNAAAVDALCEKLNLGEHVTNVIVAVKGGMVQGARSDAPASLEVFDQDIDEAAIRRQFEIPDDQTIDDYWVKNVGERYPIAIH